MEVTRIISLRQFDGNKCRFSNVVFKHSSGTAQNTPDGKLGISVFDNNCACNPVTGDCICAHIATFYGQIFQEPCAYWTFETNLLQPPDPNPQNIPTPVLVNAPSATGDACHYTIHNITDSRAQRLFEQRVTDGHLRLCVDGHSIAFDCETATRLKGESYPDPR